MKLLDRIIAATSSSGKSDLKKNMIFKDTKSNAGGKNDILLKAMEMAIHESDIVTITRLIANGGDVYSSLIIFAASNGYQDEVSQLLAMGANINAKNSDGFSALMLAVSNGHADVVDLLIENGADISAKWNICVGLTILMMAAFKGHTNIVTQLLAKNVDVNVKESEGLTALMIAAHEGHKEVVAQLLAKSADVSTTNLEGLTALKIAARNGHEEIVEMLKEARATDEQR